MISKSHSIKKQLLIWISLPILIASVLILALAFYFSWHEIEEVYDAQLVHTAKTLIQLTQNEIGQERNDNISWGAENADEHHNYEKKTAFRIWQGETLLLQSAKAKEFPSIEAPPGFSSQIIEGKPWRFFVYIDTTRNLRIETSERYAIRYELITQLIISLAIPMSILIPSLLAIVWIGIQKSLRPLILLSEAVDKRDTDDLNPIDNKDVPQEAIPLVHALNRLFGRISESFRREREFTDHAAHELRTPMAAMKTQTQVLIKKAGALPECRDGLENLNATIDRATHLLEQLLSLARLQNENFPLSNINLSHTVREVIRDIISKAQEKRQTLNVSIANDIYVKGHENSLYILLRNLLDNALKYTPQNGTITVSLAKDGQLQIADTGPGISDEDKQRVFRRFVRADKTGQSGSGLGLSIVQWIADAQGIIIGLKDNLPNGLIVEVGFNK